MTAVVVTPSVDRSWVRALTGLRGRGVAAVVVAVNAASYERGGRSGRHGVGDAVSAGSPERRALRFALAEYDLKACEGSAGDDLGTVLA